MKTAILATHYVKFYWVMHIFQLYRIKLYLMASDDYIIIVCMHA